jgi:translation initiation factor 5
MALLNVDPEKQADAFYRYKMPRVMTKVEGNGNGIKTVVCNIVEISDRLARNVEYPMRFFAHELAATSKLKDEKWTLMGLHSQEKIQTCVFDFIKRFVLCKSCRNPETVIRVDTKKNIFLDCKACSRKTDISPTEKLCNVIVKYEKPVAEKVDKVIAEATAKEKKEKKTKKEKGEKKDSSKDELNEESLDQATHQAHDHDDAIEGDQIERRNPVLVLKEFIETQPPPTADAVVSRVLDIKEEYGLTEDRFVVALVFEALFDKDIAKQFPSRYKTMARFVKTDVEKDLIAELMFLCKEEESLKPKFHILLKKFYDVDMISSETILAWHEKKKAPKGIDKDDFAFFKNKSNEFVEWLQQSDEEEDSDDSEDEAPRRPTGAGVASASLPKSAEKPADGDDEDIDIDAI